MSTAVVPATLLHPMRADARRNYERLLTAAKAAFAEQGAEASLDEIARRAGVGIGTLYRHFPTRLALQEAVIRDHTEALRSLAEELLASPSPGNALATWLRAKLSQAATYRGLGGAVMNTVLDDETELAATCKAMKSAATALLSRAQQAGAVRADLDASSLMRLVNAIALATEQAPDGPAQADRLLSLVLDGLRPPERSAE